MKVKKTAGKVDSRTIEEPDRSIALIIANKELIFQNEEKEKRAAELVIANKELAFQNDEKGKRAAELVIANKELAFQNEEKEKRAAELVIANTELAFQNEEKEKRAVELSIANKELESFTFISSHDLQEPLRKIRIFSDRLLTTESEQLSNNGKKYIDRIRSSATLMQTLINNLLDYSRIAAAERKFEKVNLSDLVDEIRGDLKEELEQLHAVIEVHATCEVHVIRFLFRQLLKNLIVNSLKFSRPGIPPHIIIDSNYIQKSAPGSTVPADHCHIRFSDNGIGFDSIYKERIFEIFQRLNEKEKYEGTGMGLTIVKRIVESHNGTITANAELNKGASFDIYLP